MTDAEWQEALSEWDNFDRSAQFDELEAAEDDFIFALLGDWEFEIPDVWQKFLNPRG